MNCVRQVGVAVTYWIGYLCYIYILNSISMLTPLGSKRSPDTATENSAEEEISVCPGKRHLRMF